MKKKEKLKNGILLISHQLPKTNCVTISISFKCGTLFENDSNNGISHLVEHLFFRQFGELSQKELYYRTLLIGAEINASTYCDYVTFSITVVPKFFIQALNLISECLHEYHWSEEVILKEKRVVIKQIENDCLTFEKWIDSFYFKNTKYAYEIMGNVEKINNLSEKEINSWKDEFFCSCNSCVTIVGNFSDNDFQYANNFLSTIKKSGELKSSIIALPKGFLKRNSQNRYTIVESDSNYSEITVFFDVPKDLDYETIRLISSMIGEGCESLLAMALRENNNFTDDVYTKLYCFYGFIDYISFSVSNSDFYESLKCLFYTLSTFKTNFKKSYYDTNINFFTVNQIMDYDSPKSLNSDYVLCDFVFDGLIVSEPTEKQRKYQKISIDEINDCSHNVFQSKNITFLIESSLNKLYIKEICEKFIDLL